MGVRAAGAHPSVLWIAVPVVAAVAAPLFLQGGFSDGSRIAFAALAASALCAALALHEGPAFAALRSPAVLAIAGLAALSLASAVWTVGAESAAVRWGLVIAGYAALAAAAAGLVDAGGARRLAFGLAALAGIEAVLGLAGVAARELPLAERLGGSWRPGGTFEYPPALALLQVSVLPMLIAAMLREGTALAAAAAGGASLAGAVLALADSRMQAALAALILLGSVLVVPRSERSRAAAAAAIVALAGIAAHLVAGRYAAPGAGAGDAGRLLGLAAVPAAAAIAWVAVSRRELPMPRVPRRAAAATGVVLALGLLTAGVLAVSGDEGRTQRHGVEPAGGIAHGRTDLWRAALDAWADRPLAGGGADAYLAASARYQEDSRVRYAHSLPLEAAAELGALGLALVITLHASVGLALWRARGSPLLLLFGPAAAAYLLANLVDWSWHLAAAGAVWAVALGAVIAAPLSARTASTARPR